MRVLPDGIRKHLRLFHDVSALQADVDAEIDFHLEQLTEELAEKGMSQHAARAEAERIFGDPELPRRACTKLSSRRTKLRKNRQMTSFFLLDIRYGLRTLRNSPGTTAVAVLTLALGIGANTAIFSVYNSVLLQPFPYDNPDKLVQIWEANPEAVTRGQLAYTDLGVNPLNYLDYRDQNSVFSSMGYAVDYAADGTITVGGDEGAPQQVGAWSISRSIFDVLGVQPLIGRPFLESERAPANNRTGRWIDVVILSNELWQRRFGSDSDIIGRRITIDGAPATVVGVMPPGFQLPPLSEWGSVTHHDADVYLPLHYPAFELGRRFHQFRVIARLRQGVSVEHASIEMQAIASRLERAYPETNTGWTAEVAPLRDILVRDFGRELTLLIAAAGFVLLIACANVANLQFARGVARRREIATRVALGAGRAGILRHLLAESLLFASFGGAVGLLFAVWGTQWLLTMVPDNLPRVPETGIDLPVFGFTLVLSLLTGIASGLAPAAMSSRINLVHAWMKVGPTTSSRVSRWRIPRLLLPVQVALAVVLLIGGGLLMQNYLRLNNVDRGYDSSNVLVSNLHGGTHHPILGTVSPDDPEYEASTRVQVDFFHEILGRLRALPGVAEATTAVSLPLQGGVGFLPLQIDGRPKDRSNTRRAEVGPGYFRTMGIPLLRGDVFSEWNPNMDWGNVALVSQTLANDLWPEENPVGKRFGFWECCDITVIGVVGDVNDRGVDDPPFNVSVDPRAVVYTPRLGGSLLVRATLNPLSIIDAVRATYSDVSGDAVLDFSTLEELESNSLARPRFYLLFVGIFAVVALALALVGLYGVIAHSVSQRTHEVGVRMALGAQRAGVRSMVVRQAMIPVLLGVIVGLACAVALAGLLATLLYGANALDPLTYVGVAVVVVIVAAGASYPPARRASQVDPVHALRYE